VRKHGLAEVSLRRLAAELGTSLRMLQYHFGSLEHFLGAVMHQLRRDLQQELIPDQAPSRAAALRATWDFYREGEHRRIMELFFFLAGQAAHDAHARTSFLDDVVDTWADALAALGRKEGLDDATAVVEARMLVAATRGLLLDWLLTGDESSTGRAFDRLVQLVTGDR